MDNITTGLIHMYGWLIFAATLGRAIYLAYAYIKRKHGKVPAEVYLLANGLGFSLLMVSI